MEEVTVCEGIWERSSGHWDAWISTLRCSASLKSVAGT